MDQTVPTQAPDRAAILWRVLALAADHHLPIPGMITFNELTPRVGIWLYADQLADVQTWRDAVDPQAELDRSEHLPNGLHKKPFAIVSCRLSVPVAGTTVQVDVRADGPATDPTGVDQAGPVAPVGPAAVTR